MKIRYLKFKNWLLTALAGLVGIPTSCTFAEEYGTPEATYNVKGTVMNAEGETIAGIGVRRVYVDDKGHKYQDTTGTDGRFDVKLFAFPGMDSVQVDFHDIDGSQHGQYHDTTVKVSFNGAEFTGGDGNWYEGEATREINVTLQREENQ